MSGYKTEQWFIEFLWRQPSEDRDGYLEPYRSKQAREQGFSLIETGLDAWAENCAASSRAGVPLADILGVEE